MRMNKLPASEYGRRVKKLQEELVKRGIDVFISYSSESESASSRYLTGFWPFFDFASIVVPAKGSAVLVTGGPESYDFAEKFSTVPGIMINPLLVESSAPEWVPEVSGVGFDQILQEVCGTAPKVIGISDWNIFPHVLLEDIKKGAPGAEYVPADDIFTFVKAVKDDIELPYIERVYQITEEAMKTALDAAKPGMREYELESIARRKMLELGAEGMPYPAWVCSGPNTPLSLCRSSDRVTQQGDLVQFTFGTKYMGYCGNMCRPFFFGDIPAQAGRLMEAALEATEYAIKTIKPGIKACDVFDGYYSILSRYGYQEFTLYGPAHGTGHSEVEGLWLSKGEDFVIQPNMLFNIDIWLTDGTYGMRYEEGILTTQDGVKELNSYRREQISL